MGALLDLDSAVFEATFGRQPFLVTHHLNDHPLLSLESLAELADFLPPELVEHNLGDVPEVLDDRDAQLKRVEQTPGEIARGIETNRCWMVLKEIEQHPAYRDLLNASLDEVEELVAGLEGPMRLRKGFVFLSAPGSVTPVHIDTEHNILLQVRGTKAMSVGEFDDSDRNDRELERLYSGEPTRYLDDRPETMQSYELESGVGICVPHSAPHSVRNGDQPSVSLSITFQTRYSERRGNVYAVNSRLRKLRISPRPPNGNGFRDRAKDAAWRLARAPRRAARAIGGRSD
jgi:hypothetical protein